MSAEMAYATVAVVAILPLLLLLLLVRWFRKRQREVDASPGLWSGRDYRCPGCGAPMVQGWVMLGRGAIWSSRGQPMPGGLSVVTRALPNTLSFSLRPGCNQAWRCTDCHLLALDHSRLVRPPKGRG
jgi:hypothetical protein